MVWTSSCSFLILAFILLKRKIAVTAQVQSDKGTEAQRFFYLKKTVVIFKI
jgi:hypothetical protein